jgi:hypothetical protein
MEDPGRNVEFTTIGKSVEIFRISIFQSLKIRLGEIIAKHGCLLFSRPLVSGPMKIAQIHRFPISSLRQARIHNAWFVSDYPWPTNHFPRLSKRPFYSVVWGIWYLKKQSKNCPFGLCVRGLKTESLVFFGSRRHLGSGSHGPKQQKKLAMTERIDENTVSNRSWNTNLDTNRNSRISQWFQLQPSENSWNPTCLGPLPDPEILRELPGCVWKGGTNPQDHLAIGKIWENYDKPW